MLVQEEEHWSLCRAKPHETLLHPLDEDISFDEPRRRCGVKCVVGALNLYAVLGNDLEKMTRGGIDDPSAATHSSAEMCSLVPFRTDVAGALILAKVTTFLRCKEESSKISDTYEEAQNVYFTIRDEDLPPPPQVSNQADPEALSRPDNGDAGALTRNGCQTGYKLLLTTCIRVDFRQKNYWGAREACEREGATLAMPKSQELDLALRNLVSKEDRNLEPWIGLKDNNYFRLFKRQWQWEDGSALRNYKETVSANGNVERTSQAEVTNTYTMTFGHESSSTMYACGNSPQAEVRGMQAETEFNSAEIKDIIIPQRTGPPLNDDEEISYGAISKTGGRGMINPMYEHGSSQQTADEAGMPEAAETEFNTAEGEDIIIPQQTGHQNNDDEEASCKEAISTVSRAMLINPMYAHGSSQRTEQPAASTMDEGAEIECTPADGPASHVYQSFDAAGIENQGHTFRQSADKKNTTLPIKSRRHASGLLTNPMYVSGGQNEEGAWLEQDSAWVVNSSGIPWVSNGITYDATKALDWDIKTYWNPGDMGQYYNNWYIVLDLAAPTTLTRIAVSNYGDITHDITNFELENSQVGSPYSWEDVVSVANVQEGTNRYQEFGVFLGTARYWRFVVTGTHSGWQPWLAELNLYTISQSSGAWLEQDSAWVVNSSGIPWVSNGITYDATKALDWDIKTYWNPGDMGQYYNNWYIVLDLAAPTTLTRIAVSNYGDITHDITNFELENSQVGSPYSWEDVVSVANVQEGTNRYQEFGAFLGTARYWRFVVTGTHSGWQPWLAELNFYTISQYSDGLSGGCRVGYKLLAGTCIRLDPREVSYGEAEKVCEGEGARLAMPKTEELDIALRNIVLTKGNNLRYWIGMRDKAVLLLHKRDWEWEDGSTLGKYTQEIMRMVQQIMTDYHASETAAHQLGQHIIFISVAAEKGSPQICSEKTNRKLQNIVSRSNNPGHFAAQCAKLMFSGPQLVSRNVQGKGKPAVDPVKTGQIRFSVSKMYPNGGSDEVWQSEVLLCDFRRENAWVEWVRKRDHGVYDDQRTVLSLLRNITANFHLIFKQPNCTAIPIFKPNTSIPIFTASTAIFKSSTSTSIFNQLTPSLTICVYFSHSYII
uniref:C-type lectin domain-containing protein n=1 Tax=Branchiostoma floridae TaxID=7739 RepID=C3YF14_BRAFL|eukprot:XP_002605248.1 hypothetical protein BRAFLDRAFT_92278 [Branchiostoma floridae]